jgi:putative ABC transport system permease protein
MGVFALLAIVLTVLGIYGLLAQITLDRSGELALRSVMGAGRRELLRIVLVQGLRPVFLGLALGLLGAYLLTRYLASILFAIEPFDPLTIVAVCAIVLVSAVVACYRPARVVSNTDPMVVLRSE